MSKGSIVAHAHGLITGTPVASKSAALRVTIVIPWSAAIGLAVPKSRQLVDDQRKSIGAGNEARTRDLNLGKVALYQLSYSRPKAEAQL